MANSIMFSRDILWVEIENDEVNPSPRDGLCKCFYAVYKLIYHSGFLVMEGTMGTRRTQ